LGVSISPGKWALRKRTAFIDDEYNLFSSSQIIRVVFQEIRITYNARERTLYCFRPEWEMALS